MRTADRARRSRAARLPGSGVNYVGHTLRQLAQQGGSIVHLQATNPNVVWLQKELAGIEDSVVLHVPETTLLPNEAGWSALEAALNDPEICYDWVILMEDDLTFCADFVGSVTRWLARYGRPDRSVFRLFGFERPRSSLRGIHAFEHRIDRTLAASQAVAFRRADAEDFITWSRANLLPGESRTTPWRSGNSFDKCIAEWAITRRPAQPGILSWPLFVDHIGIVSSLHRLGRTDHRYFAGKKWSYGG
jgi:hypothetical protein